MRSLYRFISFEAFVDLILREELVFVHPTLWDDPFELAYLDQFIKKKLENSNGDLTSSEGFDGIIHLFLYHNLYCQSWTEVEESDALWRIYSHNNMSVRIEIDVDDIQYLDNVEYTKVKYVENQKNLELDRIYEMLGYKRKAFEHEKEVRLINHYKFKDDDDIKQKFTDVLRTSGHPNLYQHIDIDEVDQEAKRVLMSTNMNLKKETESIPFGNISGFVKSVMLHPFAPKWFNKTMKYFCESYGLNYIGQSELYRLDNEIEYMLQGK